MKLRIVCGMGVLAAALSAAAFASEPRVSPSIEEIIVTAKRPQIEVIIVTARRPKELLSADTELERAPADGAKERLRERAAQPQRVF
jgi:hypothetical protein